MTKTALAVEALRSAILRGDIAPDAPLTVVRIAQMLRMSPTPVREAIRTLQAEGLLRHDPHHSVSVNRYTPQDIHDLFQMRAELESQATRIATARLDDATIVRLTELNDRMRVLAATSNADALNRLNGEWHLLIYGAADNRILLDVVQHLWKKFVWDINWILPGRSLRSIEEHDAVLAALSARDADEAAKRMRAHLQFGEDYAVAYVERKALQSATPVADSAEATEQ
jgi:DNA-binding GntR family transcriptional regulator